MRKTIVSVGLILALIVAVVLPLAGCGKAPQTLIIYHAGSLNEPFMELEAEFEQAHPNVDVLRVSGGSNKIITKSIINEQAGENPPDVIASADFSLIRDRMEPDYADWYIAFAKNKMVLCYCKDAPYANDIKGRWEYPYEEEKTGDRMWYDVLRNDDVSYGHSNPDDDPCGYRTLLLIQLAQKYYYDNAGTFGRTADKNAKDLYNTLIPGKEHERGRKPQGWEQVNTKSVDLVTMLQAGELHYAFEYRSVAVQHKLNFIELDDAINLSSTTYEDFYEGVSVEIMDKPGPPPTYKEETGKPIVYGITIPKNAQNKKLAEEFIKLLLSDTGKNIMEVENGQPFLESFLCDSPGKLPASLKDLIP
jgi:molybdate/tungstate transport system substrate-binding protein